MKNIFVFLSLAFLFATSKGYGQSATWDYNNGYLTISGSNVTLKTYYQATMQPLEAIQQKVSKIYKLTQPTGGIIATVSGGGSVSIKVNLFDPNKTGNLGPELYSCYTDITSSTYVEKATTKVETPADTINDPVWRDFAYGDNYLGGNRTRQSTDIALTAYAAEYSYKKNTGANMSFLPVFQNTIPVFITITATNAVVARIKIPGIGEFAPYDAFYQPSKNINAITNVFKNPSSYPNYLMVAAHRGYFRDVADNSLEALRLAIGLDVPMVEIDIQLAKDSVWVLSHDANIGETDRTRVPTRLSAMYDSCIAIGKKGIPVEWLTLCEMRPDLCNASCPYGATSGACEPVWLTQQDGGTNSVAIPSLEDAMFLCKQKVLLDMDKMDKGKTRQLSRYDIIWNSVKDLGLQEKVIVKGKNWENPQQMIDSFPTVDWKKMMYTPTYFPEMNPTTANIDTWTGNANFDCPGIELIYYQENDPAYNLISYIKSKNKQVIQFPMWPEYCTHIITDERVDYRNSWNWLLDTPARRPSLIISDRLEVLLQLLQANGLQSGL